MPRLRLPAVVVYRLRVTLRRMPPKMSPRPPGTGSPRQGGPMGGRKQAPAPGSRASKKAEIIKKVTRYVSRTWIVALSLYDTSIIGSVACGDNLRTSMIFMFLVTNTRTQWRYEYSYTIWSGQGNWYKQTKNSSAARLDVSVSVGCGLGARDCIKRGWAPRG